MRLRHALPFLLLFLGAAAPALAQAGLDVTVLLRETRTPAAQILVRVSNASTGYTADGRADAQGRVRFDGLGTSGLYRVEVPMTATTAAGLADGLALRNGATRSVVVLVGAQQEAVLTEVSVTGEASFAEVNRTNAEVSATLTPREILALPIEGRDITRALFRLPGVTQATGFYPEAPNVSVNGANPLFVNYLLDGLDNNEQFLGGTRQNVPIGFVQDVTALTSAFSAQYGRTGNGVINVTTRSGGNRVTGEGFYLTRPGSVIDGTIRVGGNELPQRDLLGNPVKEGFMRQQAGGAVGGPIRRDRTFYFVNVEGTLDVKDNLLTSPALGVNETVRGENRALYASARLDQIWSARLRSALRLTGSLVENERQGGGLDGGAAFPSAASTQTRNGFAAALTNTYAKGNLVVESNVLGGRFVWDYARPEGDARPQVVVLDPQEQVVAVLGHPGYAFASYQTTLQTQQRATLVRGRHTLRAGLDVLATDHELDGGGNEAGNYTVKLTDTQLAGLRGAGRDLQPSSLPMNATVVGYGVELQPKRYGVAQVQTALYAEDQFRPAARLTLTAGVRYDIDNLSRGGSARYDLNNVAPRLAFNYGLDARSVVRGGYGVFYDKVLYAVYSDALQQNSTAAGYRQQIQQLVALGILPASTDLDRVTFDGNVTANFSGVAYLNGPTPGSAAAQRATATANERRILNPNGYDNPYTHQASLGYQRQLGRGLVAFADGVYARGYNLFRLRNLNAPTSYTVPESGAGPRSAAAADATRPVAVVAGGAKNIVMSETRGHSRYAALTANLVQERGAARLASLPVSYRLSYTLSRLENDTEDINFRAADANRFGAEGGPSINDRTHVVSGVAYAYPLRGLTTSVAALVQSGQPVNRIPDATVYGTTDLNGDGQSFGDAYVGNSDRQPGEGRNADRLPWSRVFDVGLQYDLPLAGRRIELRADVFNVFNTANLSGYSNNATQSNQIQIGPSSAGIVKKNAGAPRQFQFGLRVGF